MEGYKNYSKAQVEAAVNRMCFHALVQHMENILINIPKPASGKERFWYNKLKSNANMYNRSLENHLDEVMLEQLDTIANVFDEAYEQVVAELKSEFKKL